MHIFKAALLSAVALPGAACANGFGEDRPWQFRTPAERQVLLQQEQTRLNFMIFEQSGLGAAGLGGQTGNAITISISGDGDNTIDVGQENTGDQTIQDAEGSGTNTVGGAGASAPAALAPTPEQGVQDAAAALQALD
ncbi:hypothetical protein BCF33_0369 [Hasllibacter halocynthiae]|uniref:Curlin associated repeat-containing protein n=1 Tax=Hasllibacter halocynthiae TaxID=595589 RepID=A0A2T0X734_9RHOB|nr:hypothetical protein [Hasllibacter halocynthiae]PRY94771.1 hypothetical protein BCF33_0369 [Hasllibacter halocynthiae]